jgi:hypothetical protein
MKNNNNQARHQKTTRGGVLTKEDRDMLSKSDRIGILDEIIDAGAWAAICETAMEQAIRGNSNAREWITDHLLPKGSLLEYPGDEYSTLEDFLRR